MNRIEDGTVIYESPAARELLGFPESQEGKSVISRWVDPKDRERYLDQLRKDGGVDGLEIRFRKADGEEFPCAMSSRLIEYQGESVIVSNLFDLTERKASEDELARQREMLHQSEKLSALGELLAGVSHELNNPLSVLVGQAQMLKELAADEHTATRAEKIGKAADRCARIVKTFLAMARHEPSKSVQADINAVVEDALEVTAYALRTSGIDLSLRLAKNLPQIYCDPDQMRQVITNLVINAQHALLDVEGPRKLSVTTHFRKRSDRIAIKVKDNGPGVPEEIRGRIFEPLFTTKEIGTGTGMGLALCHRIVEAHGGTINLESGHGKGSAFAVRLPCAVSKKSANALPKINQNIAGKHRVLVVDDEYDVGEIISDVLQFDGYAVDVAGSGKTALDLIKRQHYDVILSDIRMPGMDGPTFYRVLSGMESQLINGLAFITGDTLSPQVREFLDAAERPYLEKPLMARDIRELVELLIRRQHDC
jgi:PAS domain S-box-containing protein